MVSIKSDQTLDQAQRSLKSHRWSIILGNLLEHFDSALYGFLAPLVGKAFFPDFAPLYQLILTYGIYIITFLARPLGGLFFSKLTYHYGPLRALLWALMGVATTTGLMGLLPDAHQVGILAPFLLISVRFMQSFCNAGESAIAGYYLIEKLSKTKQMSWSGIYESSTVLGILMASTLSSLILSASENEELWRFAFLLGFALGIWSLWMRFSCQREEEIAPPPSHKKILPCLKDNWKLVLYLVPIYGFSYLTYSIPCVFLNPFLAQTTPLTLSTLMQQTSSLLWLDALLLPAVAFLVQRFHWHKTLLWCALTFALGACSMLIFFPYHSLSAIFLLRLVMVMGGVGFTAALIPWTASLYPIRDKYLLHSVSYNIGTELFGRSAPAICLSLYALTNHSSSPLIYILSLTSVTLGFIFWLQFSHFAKE